MRIACLALRFARNPRRHINELPCSAFVLLFPHTGLSAKLHPLGICRVTVPTTVAFQPMHDLGLMCNERTRKTHNCQSNGTLPRAKISRGIRVLRGFRLYMGARFPLSALACLATRNRATAM